MKIAPIEGSDVLFVHGVGSNLFRLTDIMYAESLAHEGKPNFIRLNLINGKFCETHGSLIELEETTKDFYKANRRQAFNIIHCDRVEGNEIVLKQNKRIQFSRRELSEFKKTMGHKVVKSVRK